MAIPRLVAAVIACTVGLGFWWALTEPLPILSVLLFSLPVVMLFATGTIAGRLGVLAAPISLLFSLLLGSLIGTWIHRAFVPTWPAVSSFGGMSLNSAETLTIPLLIAAVIGASGGLVGERLFPLRRR